MFSDGQVVYVRLRDEHGNVYFETGKIALDTSHTRPPDWYAVIGDVVAVRCGGQLFTEEEYRLMKEEKVVWREDSRHPDLGPPPMR